VNRGRCAATQAWFVSVSNPPKHSTTADVSQLERSRLKARQPAKRYDIFVADDVSHALMSISKAWHSWNSWCIFVTDDVSQELISALNSKQWLNIKPISVTLDVFHAPMP